MELAPQVIQTNPARKSLILFSESRFPDYDLVKEAGFSFYYPYNQKYRDNNMELYSNHHYQLSDLLATKLTRTYKSPRLNKKIEGINQQISEHPEAREWLDNSLATLRQVRLIKNMDMPTITKAIEDFGLDPALFKRPFREHQLQSLAIHIVLGYSNNWGQQRTGKTPPAIVFNAALLLKGDISTCLVVCPASIKWTWHRELAKDLAEAVQSVSHVIEGTKAKRVELLNKPSFFKIINYESLAATIEETHHALEGIKYSVVLDECQYVKNESQRTAAAESLYISDNPPQYSICLSGTPVANTPIDVARPVQMTAPGLLAKSIQDFHDRYTFSSGNYRASYKGGALESIADKMARCSTRVLRADCGLDLGLQIDPQMLDMGTRQSKIYADIRDILRAELLSAGGEMVGIKVNSFLAQAQKLQQVTDGFLYDRNGNALWLPESDQCKLKWLDNYIKDYLYDIEKLVIFSRFKSVLRFLEIRHKHHGVVRIDGDVKKSHDRDNLVYDFQTKPEIRIMFMNTAVAMGQDLNPATFAIAVDRMFYLMPNEQADARITGILQTADATIMPLVCRKTVDEALVFKILPRKREHADIVLGDEGKSIPKFKSGAYTQQDLLDLVS